LQGQFSSFAHQNIQTSGKKFVNQLGEIAHDSLPMKTHKQRSGKLSHLLANACSGAAPPGFTRAKAKCSRSP
jgi:hypothetical protein